MLAFQRFQGRAPVAPLFAPSIPAFDIRKGRRVRLVEEGWHGIRNSQGREYSRGSAGASARLLEFRSRFPERKAERSGEARSDALEARMLYPWHIRSCNLIGIDDSGLAPFDPSSTLVRLISRGWLFRVARPGAATGRYSSEISLAQGERFVAGCAK